MKKTVLITGFAPFGGETTNPSWQVVSQLQGWQPSPNFEVVAAELACAFADSAKQLTQLISAFNPCLVLAVGQAGGRTQICLEKVAINLIEARIPDNVGYQPSGLAIAPDGPAAYFAKLPLKSMLQALHQANIPAAISYTAGTFVCFRDLRWRGCTRNMAADCLRATSEASWARLSRSTRQSGRLPFIARRCSSRSTMASQPPQLRSKRKSPQMEQSF